jgi:5-methylcytosine-specific restriction endonuclease McrA
MYSKTDQTTSKDVKKKRCPDCETNRDMKFFTSSRAKRCKDCTVKKWRKAWKERPAAKTKKADSGWAKAVKERDGFLCVYCGGDTNLNSHHIFSRSHQGLRYDINNGITLCSKHHVFSTEFSAHKTPAEFIEWVKEKKGLEWYESLRIKAREVFKKNAQLV